MPPLASENNIFISNNEIIAQKQTAEELRNRFAREGRIPGVYITTLGCQQNESDSERILGACELCGYTAVSDINDAELIIFNTCAIREHAELKAFSGFGEIKRLKAEKPNLITAVCGCMPQEKHVREKLFASYPYIDVVFGTDMHHRVPEIISAALCRTKRLVFVNDKPHNEFGVISEDMPQKRQKTHRGWLSVMYGCDNFCSYCIVPYARGRERSRLKKDVISEAAELIAGGCRDITLLGQNVNSYNGGTSFPGILKEIAEMEGDFWLRFMTSHPKDASGELIKTMADNPKIARHFHLPVQSGNNNILNRMNRGYTREKYLKIIENLRKSIPDISITSDIICGFPGETEKEFEDTLSLVEEVGFDMLYTFVYSPRKGTKAAEYPDQIPHDEKIRRFNMLSELQNSIANDINQKSVGKTLRVLSDGKSGRDTRNKIINFDRFIPEGDFVNVRITAAQAYSMEGKVLIK